MHREASCIGFLLCLAARGLGLTPGLARSLPGLLRHDEHLVTPIR